MAIVKANYTRTGRVAKASVRYIENRPGKDGTKIQRTLFTADGKVERGEAYTMIDQAANGSYFFRLVISPDPQREDSGKNLSLRELTEKTVQSLEDRFQRPLQWVAAIHADHAEHRHVHAIAIVPERLQVQDFQRTRSAATAEALEQLRQLDLAREQRALSQEQDEGVGYERKLVEALKRYIDLLKFLGVEPPLFIMVSFLGVKGYKIAFHKSDDHITEYTDEIDRTNFIIPEIMIENFDVNLAETMKPIFDTVWNAAGDTGSPNYDTEGTFAFVY